MLAEDECLNWEYTANERAAGSFKDSMLPADLQDHPFFKRLLAEEKKGWHGTVTVLFFLHPARAYAPVRLRFVNLTLLCAFQGHPLHARAGVAVRNAAQVPVSSVLLADCLLMSSSGRYHPFIQPDNFNPADEKRLRPAWCARCVSLDCSHIA